ncbi:MAG: hypothetical protein AB8F34_13985 [Akkermansiaceae bacterium]
MTKDHYTFVGCSCALDFYVNASNAADKQTALDACANLTSVREAIMVACAADPSDEKAAEVFKDNVATVLESIEAIRSTSLVSELDSTLVDLLDHFYDTADSIMGGGGGSDDWLSSGSGSGAPSW